jgi:hypothetical protein
MPFPDRDDGDIDYSVSNYSFSSSGTDDDDNNEDDEYLQALKVLADLRSSTTTRQPLSRIRKRQSVTSLQELMPSSSSSSSQVSPRQTTADDEGGDSWGFYLDSQPAKPPLFRPSRMTMGMRRRGGASSSLALSAAAGRSPPKPFWILDTFPTLYYWETVCTDFYTKHHIIYKGRRWQKTVPFWLDF